jgi:N-acetylglucosamine-6-phosphate deacetylase
VGKKLFRDAVLMDPEAGGPQPGAILVEQGRIRDRFPAAVNLPSGLEEISLGGRRLAPGFIDLHFHGELIYASADRIPEALRRTAASLVRHGATAYLATTVAGSAPRLSEFMTHCQVEMTQTRPGAASLLGVHLEGPWINARLAGAQPAAPIRAFESTEDIQLLDSFSEIIRMVTLAPELPGAPELIDALARRRVISALGHSAASPEEIDAAARRGMTHVTHLFNAMGPIHHREPGVAICAMTDERLTCDLICDGVHVNPRAVDLAARVLADRLILITDRIDVPPGDDASFGSGRVIDDGSALRLPDGRLAGSTLTLDRAIRNARSFGAMSDLEAIAAATLRPAKVLGLESERGSLRIGARADFAILDPDGSVAQTWIQGERAA